MGPDNARNDYAQASFPFKGLPSSTKFVTKPFPYQAETIEWMLARENEPPADGISGGFVFHQMGLGKTLCALACTVLAENPGRTLVVCPASLVHVWVAETSQHFANVDAFLYYGSSRKDAYLERAHYETLPNIFVTAYTTVVSDIDDPDGPFQKESFHRLILDESHFIRNSKTKAFLAIEKVPAAVKWLLSGTPLPNSVTEMFPYLKLLGYRYVKNVDQLSKKAFTNRFMTRTGYLHMQAILKRVAIRRGKEVLPLPERKSRNVPVEMAGDERQFYIALKAYSKGRLGKLIRNLRRVSHSGLGRQLQARLRMINLQSVLSLIFHLRLACCDPQLVIGKLPRTRKGSSDITEAARILTAATVGANHGNGDDADDCPVCHDDAATIVNVSCNHRACRNCWDKLLAIEPAPICFECMSVMSGQNLRVMETETIVQEQPQPREGKRAPPFRSSKTRAIMKRIQHEIQRGEKIIVVSQWTSYLDVLVTDFVRRHPDVPFVVLTGKVPPTKRQEIIARFQNDETERVLFASLGSSAEGVTLTAASRMVISEPYWNQAKIDQMSDRVHRIGQKKDVKVYNMYFEQSIEAKILELVEKKAANVAVILECQRVTGAAEGWLSKVVRLLED